MMPGAVRQFESTVIAKNIVTVRIQPQPPEIHGKPEIGPRVFSKEGEQPR
jgi:hypothetical protein